ncbi:hypothetical protein HK104_003796 [Borealophlyctis nickersoniae]|nr:hypothetical protein HK104_003796 [Borealophlyctis nickersoniae]
MCVSLKCFHHHLFQYLDAFVAHFSDVHHFMRQENVFQSNEPLAETALSHIVAFGWEIANDAPKDPPPQTQSPRGTGEPTWEEKNLGRVMKLIRIFSRVESLAATIGKNRGVPFILQVMKSFPFCIPIQIDCSASLANLASVEENRTLMLRDGCIKLVLENMSKFMDSPAVQAEVCATLANLASHDANAKYIVRNGGCTLILRAMRLHMDQMDLQIQALHALASLGKPGRDVLDKENFMPLLMRALTVHRRDIQVVSAVLHAVGSLAVTGMPMIAYKDKIISMIFTAMHDFKNAYTFQITACFALAHLSFMHITDETVITTQDGLGLILNAMRRFPEVESLQTTALFALGSIVMSNDKHRQAVLKRNGIPLIIGAMRRRYAPTSAKATCSRRDSGIEDVGQDQEEDDLRDSEPVLFARGHSRIQYPRPLLLQLFASVALLNLSDNEKCRIEIIQAGGIHYIFEALQRVKDHTDLWFILYFIFTRFTKNDDRAVYMKPRG